MALKEGYTVKVHNKLTKGTRYLHFRELARAREKARELRKNPRYGVSLYKVSRQ